MIRRPTSCLAWTIALGAIACAPRSPGIYLGPLCEAPGPGAQPPIVSQAVRPDSSLVAYGRAGLVVIARDAATRTAIGHSVVHLEARSDSVSVRVDADEDGKAMLDSLPAGTARIRVLRIGFEPYSAPIELRAGHRDTVVLSLAVSRLCLWAESSAEVH